MLEGVAYGLRDSLELLRELGVAPEKGRVSGGGARSRLWLEIVASVLDLPLELTVVEEGSAYGAALLAGVADGTFADAREAVAACVRTRETVEPNACLGGGVRGGLRSLSRAVPGPATTWRSMSSGEDPLRHPLDGAHQPAGHPGAHASDKVELIAVASRDQTRAEEYARKWDIERAYGSYDALLEDPDVDAVYISLPNTMHVEWSIRAVEAGKHVLCEKPFSRHPEDVEKAFDAAERAGRLLSEAFMYRHNPQTKRLTELVRDGAIGELRVVRAAFSYSLYDADNIRLRTDVEGGSLMDVGCYCVSGSRLLAGEPETCSAARTPGRPGPTGSSPGACAFPGDVVALFDCGTSLPDRDELEAIGTEGSLFLDDPVALQSPGDRAADGRRGRAHRARPRRLVPARAREPGRRDPRRGSAPVGTRGRGRASAGARGAPPLGRDRLERHPLVGERRRHGSPYRRPSPRPRSFPSSAPRADRRRTCTSRPRARP